MNLSNPVADALAAFTADVPEAPSRPRPITKAALATTHKLRHETDHRYDGITSIAGTITYNGGNLREAAQTIYLLIDDQTPDGADVDPMLAQAYQALTRAVQLAFEAETHLYRYINRLENERRAEEAYNTEMFAEHGTP